MGKWNVECGVEFMALYFVRPGVFDYLKIAEQKAEQNHMNFLFLIDIF